LSQIKCESEENGGETPPPATALLVTVLNRKLSDHATYGDGKTVSFAIENIDDLTQRTGSLPV